MTRVLFFGDLAPTGFGTVTMDLGRALLDLGEDIRFVSQNEMDDLEEPFLSRTFTVNDPSGWHELKSKPIMGLIDGTLWPDGWQPEKVVLLGDYLGVQRLIAKDPAAFRMVPTYHYVPIEGIDLPPAWAETWNVASPIAITESGADEIEKVMGERPPVVYHGVDTASFWPVSPERPIYLDTPRGTKKIRSKADCKRHLNAPPDATWIFRADRHMPRKLYNAWIRAMVPVVMSAPTLTYAVIHAAPDDEGGHLREYLSKLPDKVRAHFIITGMHERWGYVPREILNILYNAADVYVSGCAEGFGLTIAEAMACGVPAVGLDFSSVPEVIGPGGKLVPVGHLIDNPYDYFWAAPNERAMGQIVHDLLADPAEMRALGQAGARHVRETFTWSAAARQFAAILNVAEGVAA